jgi:hypothetical protein
MIWSSSQVAPPAQPARRTRAIAALAPVLATVTLAAMVGACRREAASDQAQIGAAVGEVLAGIDESTRGSGATAQLPAFPIFHPPAELKGPLWRRALDGVVPSAYAAGACAQSLFAACTAGQRTRQLEACAVGAVTVDGVVTLAFSDPSSCQVASTGDWVNRTAELTLTGPYGGTLAITSAGGGQTLIKTAAGFDYSVQGMERVLTGPGGHTLFDVATRTITPISLTGSSRADLVIVAGVLEVTHKLAGYKVTLTAQNIAWASTCNCAVSGRLTGAVSGGGKLDGKTAAVDITACGEAEVTVDGQTESVTLDRCGPL